jgi:hypothetical protein
MNEFGTADRGIMDSNAAFAFGLPYGTSDQGYVSPYGTADDQGANLLGVPEMTAALPTSNQPEYMFAGLTDKQKMLLDQRKGMLDALGDQGILDTIRSEDDPNDPATLKDVRNYYNIA